MLNMAPSIPKSPPFFTTPIHLINSKNPQKTSCKIKSFPLSCLTINNPISIQPSTVSQKVQRLNFEFKSLPKPIERVKRLLEYASLLPPIDESLRVHENRVMGCTTQVWLEVKMDQNGVMRFRVDSDSEITKGFCSCLIWVMDGGLAEDVLRVEIDDLVEMNVGLPSRGNSRVNTWHNVLISMQKRTKDLVEDRGRKNDNDYDQCLEGFSSLLGVNGRSCKDQNQV